MIYIEEKQLLVLISTEIDESSAEIDEISTEIDRSSTEIDGSSTEIDFVFHVEEGQLLGE